MSKLEMKIDKIRDLVGGSDDIVGMWNAFIKENDEMQKLKAKSGEDLFDKALHIRDNVVDQIGELCGGDYKQFLADILQNYEDSGYVHWSAGEDWVVCDGSGLYYSAEYADGMLDHILTSELIDNAGNGITPIEIADHFIKYIKKNM